MAFFTILSTIFIEPLKFIFGLIFQYANELIDHPGLSIICLSLAMNVLVLPLYRRADAMQEEARDIDAKLSKGVAHIKKSFSGDERMMILQTYYRQNNYKPTDALKGSVSLLLEIPFFMAAYQFLSHLDILKGASLGPITDLGSPDGLIVIGGLAINLLPILMTLINVISSALYLKGFPLKTKIQLYGMALFFLVFLYTSPSGLVFYWTLNNLFSLVKTIFYKIKEPAKVLRFLGVIAGAAIIVCDAVITFENPDLNKVLILLGAVLILPMIIHIVKSKVSFKLSAKEPVPNKKLFLIGSIFLTVLLGFVIPSNYISASPQEYVDITYFYHPMWYVVSTAALAAGTFLVWFRVFYWLAKPSGKVLFERIVWILSGVTFVNYMFFGRKLGVVSSTLQYENGVSFAAKEKIINLLILAALAALMLYIAIKWTKAATTVLLLAVVAFGAMSAVNMVKIKNSIDEITADATAQTPHFNLSTEGENVIVLMLDRAMGEYVPYLFNEKPELKEQFDGFTYYSNTISHGGFTNFGTPGLLGGYEYTPVEMNRRDDKSLVDKHNEALLVMPVLFSDQGYDVTVCDPPYANYEWIPDMSIYDEYPEINTYITKGLYSSENAKKLTISNNHRNFFCHSLMKAMPLFMQPSIYASGSYRQIPVVSEDSYSGQTREGDGLDRSTGLHKLFMDPYNVLTKMDELTHITEGDQNTFLFMANDTTHDPMLVQAPEYVPSYTVDNTEYNKTHKDRFTVDGRTIDVDSEFKMIHYVTNMATMVQIGEWLDYLRECGVYDNTKIIIVSDHGRDTYHFKELYMYRNEEKTMGENVESYYPLLMVKDFGATGFNVSDEFMTNADVPTLATKDCIDNPVNPFTGNPLNSDEKTAHEQFIILSKEFRVGVNNGNTFLPSAWASVKDDLWNRDNWTFYNDEIVLKEHKAP